MTAFDINKRLLKLYGRDTAVDKPLFKVVRSETQVEKRYGTYNVFYGDIFLRTETGTREIKKYWYLPPCWILERLQRVENRQTYDIVQDSHTYEPILTFLDGDNKEIPLRWRPIELAIQVWLNPQEFQKRTEKDDFIDEQKKIEKERQEIRDMIDTTDTELALQTGEGVVNPWEGSKDKSKESEDATSRDSNVSVDLPVSN